MVQQSDCFVKEGINVKILFFVCIYAAVYTITRGTIRAIMRKREQCQTGLYCLAERNEVVEISIHSPMQGETHVHPTRMQLTPFGSGALPDSLSG